MSDTESDVAEREDGLSWAWDLVQPYESVQRGGSILVHTREDKNDPEHVPNSTLFIASTDDEDRAMDVVKQDWRLANYRRNPVVLDGHDPRRVVGKAISVKVPKQGEDAGKLILRALWDLDNPDPTLRAVGHQHLNGFRSAGSVGFRHGKKTRRDKLDQGDRYYKPAKKVEMWWGGEVEMAGFLYESNELLEHSSVPLPMNANALQRSLLAEYAAHDPEDIEARARVVAQTVPKDIAEDITAMLKHPEQLTAEQRKALVEQLAPDLLIVTREQHRAQLLEFARTDPDFRRILRAVVESDPTPAAPPIPVNPAPGFFGQLAAMLEL